jgi:membrane associated rhomboid family serine protease
MGFLPIGDDNSMRQSAPVMVYTIIALNVAVYALQVSRGDPFTNGFSTVPFEITHGVDLVGDKTITVGGHSGVIHHYPGPSPIYLTLLTSMFMHGSPMHIIGNMLYLWIFGDQIEDLVGKLRFVLFYLCCGLAASAAQIACDPNSIIPNLGASGAIAGVLGAYLVKYPTNGVQVVVLRSLTTLPAFIVLGAWFGLQVWEQLNSRYGGAQGGVAYMAHIGGFVAGVVLVFLLSGLRTTPLGAPSAGAQDHYDRYR